MERINMTISIQSVQERGLRWTIRGGFLILLCFYLSPLATAQNVVRVDGDPILLSAQNDSPFMVPRWSPTGDRLAFTGSKYKGLWVANLDSWEPRLLTDEAAAGFGFSWSGDGGALLTRVARFDGFRRDNAVTVFDVETGEANRITEYRKRMSALPRWTADVRKVVLPGEDTFEVLDSGRSVLPGKVAEKVVPIFIARNDRVASVDVRTGEMESVAPAEAGAVLNLVESPDGSRVAFEVMGDDLIVMDSNGTNRVALGHGHRPRWSPDGQWVVYMVTEDDGHQFTSSDLFVARADGKVRVRLTRTPDALEMNPDWSPDSRFIAYDDRGFIYLLPISKE
ncbi:MAG: hypothetical protein BMS9Abin05_0793 [Rhodothermia bacterium]|nr:MAG: hypothetical protein BMS9Abin05_0793 [Rhodothermia bacterium]